MRIILASLAALSMGCAGISPELREALRNEVGLYVGDAKRCVTDPALCLLEIVTDDDRSEVVAPTVDDGS